MSDEGGISNGSDVLMTNTHCRGVVIKRNQVG